MSRRRRPQVPHSADPRQLSLDDWYVVPAAPATMPGSLAMAAELCGVLSQVLKDCPLSRAEVAARMSDLTGEAISEAMLNAWTSRSHERHRFPMEYAAAFELATGTYALGELLARKRGALLLVGKQAQDAQLGQVRRQLATLRAQERALLNELGGGQ